MKRVCAQDGDWKCSRSLPQDQFHLWFEDESVRSTSWNGDGEVETGGVRGKNDGGRGI